MVNRLAAYTMTTLFITSAEWKTHFFSLLKRSLLGLDLFLFSYLNWFDLFQRNKMLIYILVLELILINLLTQN